MSINDFLEKYQNIYLLKNDLLNPYGDLSLNQSIFNKKEFNELKLSRYEEPIPGELYNHQKIVSRFLSSKTMYSGLLLFHEPGTGKSCSAFAATELIKLESKKDKNLGIKRTLVLTRGKALEDNLKNELVFQCTKGQYIPEDYDNLSAETKIRRLNKNVSSFYTFETFEVFAKEIKKSSDKRIKENYNDIIVVIDEVHNLRLIETDDQSLNVYDQIHRFLHLIENSKVLLMSGTPMKDQPNEIASILNLILPLTKQIPTGNSFDKEFLEEKNNIKYVKEDKIDKLKEYFNGKVSYLRAMQSDAVKKVFVGKEEGDLQYFKVELDKMSDFQGKYYKEAYELDTTSEKKSGIFSNSRQASLFVFPDGSYGSEGFKNYIIEEEQKRIQVREGKGKTEKTTVFKLKQELINELSGKDNEERLEKLKKFSSKYYKTVKEILENPDQNCFVYNEYVEGSGSILFSKILDLFGISNQVITNRTAQNKKIIKIINKFNQPENKNGKNIRVIVGSQVISEGFTLNNIQQIHIHTPHWNYSETEQAIARGIRLNSHKALLESNENIVVRIFQHAATFKNVQSIDLYMYLFSETKDLSIKNIERYLKESAFDCELTKVRNQRYDDFTRDCEYEECEYTCDNVNNEDYESDELTYNLFYSDENIKKIKRKLQLYFNKNFFGTFEELKEDIKDGEKFTEFQLLSSLSEIINNKEIIKNPYGLDSYLAESDNVFYLTNSNFFYTSFTDNYYNKYPILREEVDFDSLIDNFYYESFPSNLEKIIKSKESRRKALIIELPLEIQELLLETAYKAKEELSSKNREFREWILSYFANYIHIVDDFIVSNLSKPIRCYFEGEWTDCDKEIEDKLNETLKELKEEIINNPYGYAGMVDNKNIFKIRDVSSEEAKENEADKRKETRGRKCETWEVENLIKVINKINLEIPDPSGNDSLKYSFENEDVLEMNKSELLKLIKTKDKFKKLLNVISLDILKDKSEDELQKIVFWSMQKKDIICKFIKEWFISKKLISYETEAETKKSKKIKKSKKD